MMNTKYIVIRTEAGVELLFTFPNEVAHVWFFQAVQTTKQGVPHNWLRPYSNAECVGAGFLMDGKCFGKSESLNVASRPGFDTALLERAA